MAQTKKYYQNPTTKAKKKRVLPDEIKDILDKNKVDTNVLEEYIQENKPETRGKPKGGKITSEHKKAISEANKERHRIAREAGTSKWEKHGAYSFMTKGTIPKKKRDILNSVCEERKRWIAQLGGEKNMSFMEQSMIDEAARLLFFCKLVNDHILKDKNASVMYRDESGDMKMHSGLSRNYLSFTKTYYSILKELNKISRESGGKKSKNTAMDAALRMKNKLQSD